MTDIYRAALEHYGARNQIMMAFEEMAELQKELCKHSRGEDNVRFIAEEIQAQKGRKLRRLKERMGC